MTIMMKAAAAEAAAVDLLVFVVVDTYIINYINTFL
jgi:hypothetical protein